MGYLQERRTSIITGTLADVVGVCWILFVTILGVYMYVIE